MTDLPTRVYRVFLLNADVSDEKTLTSVSTEIQRTKTPISVTETSFRNVYIQPS